MKFFLSLIACAFLVNAHAATTGIIEKDDNLDSFAKRNIDQFKIKYAGDLDAFKKDIVKWNRQIKDWSHLKAGNPLFVDYPYPHFVPDTSYTDLPQPEIYGAETDQIYSFFGFVTSSFGQYTEETVDQTVKSGQNFPITIGTAFSFSNEERVHFLNTSLYWAKSSNGNVSGNLSSNSKITIPGELGYNLYYQYFVRERLLGFYGGYDYEKLNTFNTDQLVLGTQIHNIRNDLHYATFGVNKAFMLGSNTLSFKASLAKTIASDTNGSKKLTGSRYLLYFSFRPEGRFSYNILYKHHDLNGPTKLSINRVGFSVGFQFF